MGAAIADKTVGGIGHADNRGFSTDPSARFRVAVAWNTDAGEVVIEASPSCAALIGCKSPVGFGKGNNLVVNEAPDGGASSTLTHKTPLPA